MSANEKLKGLGLETATSVSTVAGCNGERAASVRLADSTGSSRVIFKAVAQVLEELEIGVEDLDFVAFGCGPGSFTGVRVACSAAQALAYSQSLPVCPVSTLQSLAHVAFQRHKVQRIAAVLDARMGEVFTGCYEFSSSGICTAVRPDALEHPDEFRLPEEFEGVLAAGAGWSVWPDMQLNNKLRLGKIDVELWPDASAVLEIAKSQFASGNYVSASKALPNYIRNKVTH